MEAENRMRQNSPGLGLGRSPGPSSMPCADAHSGARPRPRRSSNDRRPLRGLPRAPRSLPVRLAVLALYACTLLVGALAAGAVGELSGSIGGYVTGNIYYALNPDWELFGGVQFQSVGKYTHALNGPVAELDLSETLFVTLGASWSF